MVRAIEARVMGIARVKEELLAYSHRLLHFGKLGLIHDDGFNLIMPRRKGCAVKVVMGDSQEPFLVYEGDGNGNYSALRSVEERCGAFNSRSRESKNLDDLDFGL